MVPSSAGAHHRCVMVVDTQIPTPPSDAAPGCAAALRTLQTKSTHLVGVTLQQGHGSRKSKHVANHRPWTNTGGAFWTIGHGGDLEGIAPGPGQAHMVGSQGASGPEAHPAVPAPPAASPIRLHSIQPLSSLLSSFVSGTRIRRENNKKVGTTNLADPRRPFATMAGGNGRALLLPWSRLVGSLPSKRPVRH